MNKLRSSLSVSKNSTKRKKTLLACRCTDVRFKFWDVTIKLVKRAKTTASHFFCGYLLEKQTASHFFCGYLLEKHTASHFFCGYLLEKYWECECAFFQLQDTENVSAPFFSYRLKNCLMHFTHVTLNIWFFHFGLMEPFIKVTKLLSRIIRFKKNHFIRFSGDVWKTPILKISEDSKKTLFGGVLLKQFEESIVSPITILKTDSIVNNSGESS